MSLAARSRRLSESATAAVFRRAAELKAQGVDLISLAVGEPDFPAPAHVRDATKRAIDAGAARYTEVAGLRSLRQAIAADSARRRGVEHDVAEIVVSAGAKHALFNAAQVLYDHGDEVVIPVPSWGSYVDQARLCGATPVLVPCEERDGFLVRPEALAAALSPRTKAVVLCTPSNPTGAAYDRDALSAIAAVLREHHAYVIVDEIYAALCYDGFEPVSLLEVAPDLKSRVVIVDGVSKRFAMTGYRVGWMLAAREIAAACEALQSQTTTSVATPAQLAAQAALEGAQDSVLAMREAFQRRRDLLLSALAEIPGLRAHRPCGAFYLFVSVSDLLGRGGLQDDVQFAEYLLERARVAVVPGSAFGAPGYVRLSYATGEADLARAAERIAGAVSDLPPR